MKKKLEELIKIKIAISLNKLLKRSKSSTITEDVDIAKSYNKIALNADLRKATVSDTFNAKSIPSFITLILIVEAMGFKLTEFSEIFYSIKEIDVKNFRNRKSDLK